MAQLGRRLPGALAGLIGVWLLFAVLAPSSFRDPANLETIARQTAITGTVALGATLIIIAGGIDLSVGSVAAFAGVATAWALAHGAPAAVAASAGALAGLLCGLTNGALISRLGVVPFIVTLGMMLVVRGAAKGLAGEQKIDAPMSGLNDLLASLPPDGRWMLVPPGVWMLLLMAVVIAAGLSFTTAGRALFATGGNREAARLSGISVNKVTVGVYATGGLLSGIAGVFQFSRLTVGDPTAAVGLELDAIAAVVIGGGSFSGGEGSIPGTLLGALITTTIRSGCSQMGLANWIQEIVTGGIIVLAVALDRLRRR